MRESQKKVNTLYYEHTQQSDAGSNVFVCCVEMILFDYYSLGTKVGVAVYDTPDPWPGISYHMHEYHSLYSI